MGGALLTTLLPDTHIWAWTLTDDRRISDRARRAIAEASTIIVSAISFHEIAQKVRLGKWPEMRRKSSGCGTFWTAKGPWPWRSKPRTA